MNNTKNSSKILNKVVPMNYDENFKLGIVLVIKAVSCITTIVVPFI